RLELAAADLADRHLQLVGQVHDVVEDRRRVEVARQHDLAHAPGAGEQQLEHGVTPFDLLAAETPPTAALGADRRGAPKARAAPLRRRAPSAAARRATTATAAPGRSTTAARRPAACCATTATAAPGRSTTAA